MTEEELKKKNIRFNRWALLIGLLLVAGGCAALALLMTIFGSDEKHPGKLGKGGLVFGAGLFFLWRAVKYLILSL